MTIQFVISSFITGAIGVAAWFIAFQQLRINKTLSAEQIRLTEAKLRFDLYERRLALFRTVKGFAGRITMAGEADDTGAFYHDTIERHFLFDKDVADYIGKVYDEALELNRINIRMGGTNLTQDDQEQLKERKVALLNWFYEQEQNVIKVFSRDLSIRTLGQSGALVPKK